MASKSSSCVTWLGLRLVLGARVRVRVRVRARARARVRELFVCDRAVGSLALAEAAQGVLRECQVEARIRIGAKVRRRGWPPPVGCKAEEAGHNGGREGGSSGRQGGRQGSGGRAATRVGSLRPEPRSAAVAGC